MESDIWEAEGTGQRTTPGGRGVLRSDMKTLKDRRRDIRTENRRTRERERERELQWRWWAE